MKKINKYIKYVAALALLPVVTACFTGIENTGRITDRDVARVKANKRTAEEALLDSVKPQTYGQWRKGKRFVVTSNDISLVLRPSADTLKGHTLTFAGQELQRDIDNIEKVVIVLSDTDRQYRYDTGKTLAELQPLSGYYAVPFLSDLDYVARVDSLLRGRTLYLRTSTWRRRDGSFETGLRYVPVTVESVTTGDAVYPFYVAFDQDGRHSGVMMSSPTSAVRNVTFDKLFSFSDIRNNYKHISNENWSLIVRGLVAVGMTKEECTLSLGAPQSVDRVPTHGGLLERWVYDNGVYLVFADGILERFRQ